MSVLNQSGEEQECPLCLEALEVDDLNFYPCTCGYQICRFCWNRIREMENGLCPACRKAYPENPADFTPLSQEQVVKIKTEKKAREQRRRNKTLESRRQLANVRVVQNNLVFVVGLPVRLADPEILKRQEYFGKYGKIHKVVINQSTTYAGSQGPSASAYVTYVNPADALRAIQSVNNVTVDGRVLKGSLGTTKYCANFMKNQPCPKTDCMYLHELGDPNASFSKEEMHLGMHQVYERKLHERSLARQRQQALANSTGTSTNGEKNSLKEKNQVCLSSSPMVTSSNINIVNSKSNKKGEPSSSGSPADCKEAWPSLGSSPPETDSSDNSKLHSPKPEALPNGFDDASLSQENVSSESSSPTQLRQRDDTGDGEVQNYSDDDKPPAYPGNDLDEIESDRHSLLDTHDLLDSHEHSLLDDEHSLLGEASDALMMQRHREMLASLVDTSHHRPALHPYDRHISRGILNQKDLRDDRQKHFMPLNAVDSATQLLGTNYPNPGMLTPFGVRLDGTVPGYAGVPPPPRAAGPSEPEEGRYFADNMDKFFTDFHKTQQLKQMLLGKPQNPNGVDQGMRSPRLPQNMMHAHSLETQHKQRHQELLAAQNAAVSLGASLNPTALNNINTTMNINSGINGALSSVPSGLGLTNINTNIMPMPSGLNNFNVMGSGMSNIAGMNNIGAGMNNISTGMNNIGAGMSNINAGMSNINAGMNTMGPGMNMTSGMSNIGTGMSNIGTGMNMNMRNIGANMGMNTMGNMTTGISAMGSGLNMGSNSFGGGNNKRPTAIDDDLDFDPFKETQKAFAEMMENESGLTPLESAELMRRSRMPPPGFSHMNSFGLGAPQPQPQPQHTQPPPQQQVDWTQMDPAIMSTSVNFPKQTSLLQRFNQVSLKPRTYPPNGMAKIPWPPALGQDQYIPLPPGFSDLPQNEIESK